MTPRQESGLGSLYDYGARMYSPVLGRFLSADTIVPDGKNPQAWNRFAYVLNNPLRYNDPTGHYICTADTNLNSSECRAWVEQAFSTLINGGSVGKDLVEFFRKLDKEQGITISFQGLANDFLLAPPLGNTILLPISFLNNSSLGKTALFGHEISHLEQSATERLSMRGELAAFQTEYKLRKELSIAQTDYTKAAWGNNTNPYDLNTYEDLTAAAWDLRKVPGSPYTWQSLIPPDDFSENTRPIRDANFWANLRNIFRAGQVFMEYLLPNPFAKKGG